MFSSSGSNLFPTKGIDYSSSSKSVAFAGLPSSQFLPAAVHTIPNEYLDNIATLHNNIKKACKELSKRDDNVKEDLEILALERSRLGYLRDELSRRAAMIASWERTAKTDGSIPSNVLLPSQKEVDKMNALRLEIEIRRRRDDEGCVSVEDPVANFTPEEFLINGPVHTPPCERQSFNPTGVPFVEKAISEKSMQEPIASGSSSIRSNSPVPSDIPMESAVSESLVSPLPVPEPTEQSLPPPVAYNEYEAAKFYDQLTVCLNSLWDEYSTSVSEEIGIRLMTLPNLIRLCGDADFGIPIADVISIFLSLIRTSETKLVEKRYFMILLQSIFRKLYTLESEIELTQKLFNEYLLPLSQRMKLQGRSLSYKHPPLGKSKIASLNRRKYI